MKFSNVPWDDCHAVNMTTYHLFLHRSGVARGATLFGEVYQFVGSCRDIFAKVGEIKRLDNNQIRRVGLLDQYCALAPDLGSMLLTRMLKILLQHYLPVLDIGAGRCDASSEKEPKPESPYGEQK